MTIQLFKWMMAMALALYLPLLFEHVKVLRRQDRKHTDEYVRERVESIYFSVTHFYNGLAGEAASMPASWPDFDRCYCSEAWSGLVAGMDSDFFGCNYWTGSSSLAFLYINNVEVIDRTGDKATVCLTLHNGDLAVPVLLAMVFEHDDWMIDNMTYYWNERPSRRTLDWRAEMEKTTLNKTLNDKHQTT